LSAFVPDASILPRGRRYWSYFVKISVPAS
jgi:hypothetical protein